jgi:hypothetical protein
MAVFPNIPANTFSPKSISADPFCQVFFIPAKEKID